MAVHNNKKKNKTISKVCNWIHFLSEIRLCYADGRSAQTK